MTQPNSRYPVVLPPWPFYGDDDWIRPCVFQRSGAPVNLVDEGWQDWKAQWRPAPASTTVIDINVDESQAASGIITISLDGALVRSMAHGGWWDLQSTNPSKGINNARTWFRQPTTWLLDITRAP